MDDRGRRHAGGPTSRLGRRWLLRQGGAGLASLAALALLAACGGAAAPTAAPTTAPAPAKPAGAAPTTAPAPAATKPAAAPTTAPAPAATKPAAAPTSAPAPAATKPAAVAATPAAKPAASGPAITIPFYTTENDPNTLAFFKKVGESYKKDVRPIDLSITVYSDENQLAYITTAFQAGTDLGIFAPPGSFITAWARQGSLLPLDPVIKGVGPDDFLPGTRVQIDGKDFAMPFQSNASALWYRKDLFDKAGLKPPTTYETYLAAAQTLNKDGIVGIASTIGGSPTMALQFFSPYVWQSGWDYFDREGNVTFDRPEVLEAVKRYVAIMKNAAKSMYNAGFGEIINTYSAGKAAMGTFPGRLGVNTAAKAPDIADKTGVVAVPAGPFMTGKILRTGIQHYTIYAKTAQSDETLKFLEYMTTGERELEFAMTVPGHLLPPLNSVRAKVKDYKSDFMSKHGDWVTALNDMVPSTSDPILMMGSVNNNTFKKATNVCPWSEQAWGSPAVDNQLFQEILLQNKDPEVAWKDAVTKLKQIVTKWKAENPGWKPAA